MFVEFFYTLRKAGVPATPTAFLRLQKALGLGLIESLEDFYVAARAIMVKSERYFDLYDRIFAHHFYGVEQEEDWEQELEESIRMLLNEWLRDPKELAEMLVQLLGDDVFVQLLPYGLAVGLIRFDDPVDGAIDGLGEEFLDLHGACFS